MNLSRRPIYFDCLLLLLSAVVVWLLARLGADSQRWPLLLGNTLWLAAATAAIALPMGCCLAVLLVKTDVPAKRLAIVALVTMLFVPLYLQAAGWKASLELLTWGSLEQTGLRRPLLDQWQAAIWVHAAAVIPWVTLIVGVGLWYVEPDLEEEALLDGSTVQVFFRITLARAIGAGVVAALLILILTSGEMTVTDLFRVETLAQEFYAQGGQILQSSWLAGLIMGAVLGSLVCVGFVTASRLAPPPATSSNRARTTIRLRRARWITGALLVGCLLLLVGVPIGHLVYRAGTQLQNVDGVFTRTWSARQLIEMVCTAPARFSSEFGWTLWIGSISATCALVIALPLAWSARGGSGRSLPAILVCSVCLAVPGPLIGLGLIWLLNREQSNLMILLYDRTILAPVMATLIRGLPVAVFVIWHGLRNVPDEQLDSAATEGAGRFWRFWRIVVAQRRLVIVVAWLLTLAVTTGDLAASILVIPPGIDTIPRRVFGLLHAGVNDQVAGICLANAALISALVAVALWFCRHWQDSRSAKDL